ncbi:SLOG family protein [Streptomyces decoyicus]
MTNCVVLVTGSRNWENYERVFKALELLRIKSDLLFVRHGDCPTGADRAASIWCDFYKGQGVYEIAMSADWGRYGNAAGPIRNREMVDLGADICVAFPLGPSFGTRNCMKLARQAGIPVFDLSKDVC